MNEADIPIDIHAGKLLEWLVSRRIVDKNWHLHIRNIRNKISNAITDMPAHDELLKLLSGAHINYFHCQRIVEILKTTEADSRNVFGRYGSQRMKDWQEILKMYEKDNLYLAEAAQILVRNISYEIPGIRKQIKHLEQLGEEADKKVQDLGRSERTVYGEYQQMCKQLGVSGTNLRQELIQKVFSELPGMFEQITKTVQQLKKPIELYAAFAGSDDCLPLLKHVATKGNTTVYEFIYGEPPLSVEEPTVTLELEKQVTGTEQIDFGDSDGGAIDFGDDGAIDFGDAPIEVEAGEIDWGAPVDDGGAQQIDLNISLEESGIVVEEDGHAGGIAKGPDAYSVLDSPKHRERFMNDLLELEAFLRMRLYQLGGSDKVQLLSFTMMDSFPDHDEKSLTIMVADVDTVHGALTGELLQHLHQIKHSPEYVDILTANIEQKLSSIEKMKETVKRLQEKSANFKQQSIELKPTQTKIIDQTRTLQGQIERDISKRYKNRVVNLYGTNL
ncbi:CDK5 regulatory subunit-associated protein 3 [Anopheles darlingi]|uniref:CDK5 regulatory subunit-associated protein 3 n=1 Tax=Anopheles darlingi TaxID=43151 RepID=W5J450_ANODA|nr:CDK5 regulatory subunit-associated protein 3 [Anopheles darlingi]